MNANVDMTNFITPKSVQLNADDLLGGPRTIKVTGVRANEGSAEQPISISFEGDNGKPYKACKSMRRVMVHVWGANASAYIGRSMTVYCDPDVQFGGMKVGGIRISHMSHIDKTQTMALTVTKARRDVPADALRRQLVDVRARLVVVRSRERLRRHQQAHLACRDETAPQRAPFVAALDDGRMHGDAHADTFIATSPSRSRTGRSHDLQRHLPARSTTRERQSCLLRRRIRLLHGLRDLRQQRLVSPLLVLERALVRTGAPQFELLDRRERSAVERGAEIGQFVESEIGSVHRCLHWLKVRRRCTLSQRRMCR